MDDATLAMHCLAGDAVASEALIERFHGEVFGLCMRLMAHRQDAEDITQEVFLRIFRSLHRWDSSRPLRPWIMGIAVNRCRTWLGRRGRRPESVDYLHETPDRDRSDDSAELTAELDRGLAELRPDYRTVFILFHEQGRSYEEIAETIDRPVGTVKTWLHRTRALLLDHLRARGFVASPDHDQGHDQGPAIRRRT